MTQIIAVSKIGVNVLTATNPNDFLFHSEYNTFKIILEGTKSITLIAYTNNQSFTQAHGLSFAPLVTGFAKLNGASRVFAPNGIDVELWGPKAGMLGDRKFNYITSDATNITFNFDNQDSQIAAIIRYFILEGI